MRHPQGVSPRGRRAPRQPAANLVGMESTINPALFLAGLVGVLLVLLAIGTLRAWPGHVTEARIPRLRVEARVVQSPTYRADHEGDKVVYQPLVLEYPAAGRVHRFETTSFPSDPQEWTDLVVYTDWPTPPQFASRAHGLTPPRLLHLVARVLLLIAAGLGLLAVQWVLTPPSDRLFTLCFTGFLVGMIYGAAQVIWGASDWQGSTHHSLRPDARGRTILGLVVLAASVALLVAAVQESPSRAPTAPPPPADPDEQGPPDWPWLAMWAGFVAMVGPAMTLWNASTATLTPRRSRRAEVLGRVIEPPAWNPDGRSTSDPLVGWELDGRPHSARVHMVRVVSAGQPVLLRVDPAGRRPPVEAGEHRPPTPKGLARSLLWLTAGAAVFLGGAWAMAAERGIESTAPLVAGIFGGVVMMATGPALAGAGWSWAFGPRRHAVVRVAGLVLLAGGVVWALAGIAIWATA